MKIETSLRIDASKEAIWKVVSDIKQSDKTVSAIMKIEVLEEGKEGLLGFKWRETRMMFGKEATEVMWITHVEENKYYQTRAESHGAIYYSSVGIEEKEDHCLLTMGFDAESVSFMAKVMNVLFSGMMKKSMIKAFNEDMEDIKKVVEAAG